MIGTLILLTTVFFLNFVSRIILSPLLPTIESDLNFGHGEAGTLFFLLSLGYFITLIGSGFISSRLNHRRTAILSAVAVGCALLATAAATNLWLIRVGLFMVGAASGIYLPSGMAILMAITNIRNWGKTIAVHEMAPNLGFVVAPILTEALLLRLSWHGVFGVIGLASIVAGICYALFSKGGDLPGKAPDMTLAKGLFTERSFWILLLLFGLGIGGTVGIYTFLPLYLVSEHGVERSVANTFIGLSRISGMVMPFLGGIAADCIGPKKTMTIVLVLTGAATILIGLAPGSWVLFLLFLQPLISGCFFPAGFIALSVLGPPVSIVISLVMPISFLIGGGLIPVTIGLMGDIGRFGWGIALVGMLTVGSAVLPRMLKLTIDDRNMRGL